ncbi:DUF763 domain-containing protein [Caldiplasma sukawensis]
MTERKGMADLPLHYGKPPEFLFNKMVKLTGLICKTVTEVFGTEELIRRFADPFWFHSLSLVTGFDWNSSGATTTTFHALKIYAENNEVDFFLAGGKNENIGKKSQDLERIKYNGNQLKIEKMKKDTDLLLRSDSILLQDGFDIYIHGIIGDYKGNYTCINQGMNSNIKMARRYHWYNSGNDIESRWGISSESISDKTLDLTSEKSRENRQAIMKAISERIRITGNNQATLDNFTDFKILNLSLKIPWRELDEIYQYEPSDFIELVNMKGVGKSTIRALSYIGEVVYGKGPSKTDPVRYSYALGGKDGIPHPINHHDYDEVINFFEETMRTAGYERWKRIQLLEKLSMESEKRGFYVRRIS